MRRIAPPTLTDDRIAALTPLPGRDVFLLDGDCPGLLLRVYSSGRKVWVVRARDIAGRRVQIRLGEWPTLSLDEARAQARLMLADVRLGVRFKLGPMTFRTVAEQYFRAHVDPKCKPKTKAEYRRQLETDIFPYLGEIPIQAITADHVLDVLAPFQGRVYWNRLLKGLLRPICFHAVAQGYREKDPTAGISEISESARVVDLSDPERGKLLTELEVLHRAGRISSDTVLTLKLILATGCRVSEILALTKEQIQVERGRLMWRHTKTGPKTIPLTPQVIQLLTDAGALEGAGPIFLAREGKSPHRLLRKDWDLLRKTVGLPLLRLHDLRHAYATLVRQMADPMVAMDLLGLQSPEMLMVYARATRGELARIAEQAAAAMLAPTGDTPSETRQPFPEHDQDSGNWEKAQDDQNESGERLKTALRVFLTEGRLPDHIRAYMQHPPHP